MMTMSKSLVARAALGLVALAGVVAAVPASARGYDDHYRRGGERVYVERDYRPVEYGYVREWRPAPVVYWHHAHFYRDHFRERGRW